MAISERAVLVFASLTSTGLAGLTLTQLKAFVFLSKLPTILKPVQEMMYVILCT